MLNDIGFIWTPHLKKKRDDKDEHPGSPSTVGGEDEGKGKESEVDSEEEEVVVKKSKMKRRIEI